MLKPLLEMIMSDWLPECLTVVSKENCAVGLDWKMAVLGNAVPSKPLQNVAPAGHGMSGVVSAGGCVVPPAPALPIPEVPAAPAGGIVPPPAAPIVLADPALPPDAVSLPAPPAPPLPCV